MDWLTPENWNALIALLGIIREMLSMVFLAVLVLGGAIVAMSGYLWYKVGKIAKGQLNKTNNFVKFKRQLVPKSPLNTGLFYCLIAHYYNTLLKGEG